MTDYKLVAVEPTREMWAAAGDALVALNSQHHDAISEAVYRAMLAASPAVQGEPIGWYTEDHLDDKSATTYSAEVAQRWRDKGWPVWSLYTAPQPAPEVAKLVEALELAHMALIGYLPSHRNDITDAAISHCEQALAAHRKGGEA